MAGISIGGESRCGRILGHNKNKLHGLTLIFLFLEKEKKIKERREKINESGSSKPLGRRYILESLILSLNLVFFLFGSRIIIHIHIGDHFIIPCVSTTGKKKRKRISVDKGSKWIVWPIYRSRGEKTDGYRDSVLERDSTCSNNFQGGSFRRKIRAITLEDQVHCIIDAACAALNRRVERWLSCGQCRYSRTSGSESGHGSAFPLYNRGNV